MNIFKYKTTVLLICLILFSFTSFSQQGDAVGAGVIDFLLQSKSTSSKMSSDQKIALGLIGNLFKENSQRMHDINYATASAGRTEINVNSPTDGRSATLVLDEEGNVFVLSDGRIYPVAKKVVEQAKEEFVPKNIIDNEHFPPLDLTEIEKNYRFDPNPKGTFEEYTVRNSKGEYLDDIISRFNTNKSKIEISSSRGRISQREFDNYYYGEKKIKKGYTVKMPIPPGQGAEKINFLFTCNWAKDFEGDGYDFTDFYGIKNAFSVDDKITFVIGYQLNKSNCRYILSLFNFANGNEVAKINKSAMSGKQTVIIPLEEDSYLPAGAYIANFKIVDDSYLIIASESFKFEVNKEQ
jgi:hypothetical protein